MQARRTSWRHRAWQWVDPLKDAAASGMLLGIGAASPQEIASSLGGEFDSTVAQIAEAKQKLEAAGLTLADLQAWAGNSGTMSASAADQPEEAEDD